MNWKPTIRPLARLQIAEAGDWYDSRSIGLGGDFLRTVENTIDSICRDPFQYQLIDDELRRAVLHRFPHLIIYAVSGDEVVVLRCVHSHRDPRRWLRRN